MATLPGLGVSSSSSSTGRRAAIWAPGERCPPESESSLPGAPRSGAFRGGAVPGRRPLATCSAGVPAEEAHRRGGCDPWQRPGGEGRGTKYQESRRTRPCQQRWRRDRWLPSNERREATPTTPPRGAGRPRSLLGVCICDIGTPRSMTSRGAPSAPRAPGSGHWLLGTRHGPPGAAGTPPPPAGDGRLGARYSGVEGCAFGPGQPSTPSPPSPALLKSATWPGSGGSLQLAVWRPQAERVHCWVLGGPRRCTAGGRGRRRPPGAEARRAIGRPGAAGPEGSWAEVRPSLRWPVEGGGRRQAAGLGCSALRPGLHGGVPGAPRSGGVLHGSAAW